MNEANAIPETFVATVMVVVAFENVPDAPEPGDVNVTFAPETGLFPASRTVTPGGVAKTVLTVADCGVVPAFVVIEVAAPTRLVRAKLTVDRPDAAAVTLYAPPAIAFAVNGAGGCNFFSNAVSCMSPTDIAPGAVVTFTVKTNFVGATPCNVLLVNNLVATSDGELNTANNNHQAQTQFICNLKLYLPLIMR